MIIRADSLAAHGAEGRNGGDVRLGELQWDSDRLDLCPECENEPIEEVLERLSHAEARAETFRKHLENVLYCVEACHAARLEITPGLKEFDEARAALKESK